MSVSRIFLWAFGAVFFLVNAVFGAEDDLVLQNRTIHSGEVVEYYAYHTLRAGPAFVIEAGAEVSLRAGNSVILAPGFEARLGSILRIEITDTPL